MPIEHVKPGDPESAGADAVAENVAALRRLFPQAFDEQGVDFDTLRELLGVDGMEGDERYGLNWAGKRRAARLALTPSAGTLLPAKDDSVDWDTTRNLMIEGDNLEVLKLLRKSYAGKVKLIYIDPPYNTGKDFVYPDDYVDSIDNYLRRTGQKDDDGIRNTSNPESSGRYHTDWLNMMYPRLMLARELLRQDGFIFVSADDHEIGNLRVLLDAVFGGENYASEISVINNLKGRNDRANIATCHEFLIAYAKSSSATMGQLPLTDEQRAEYKYKDENGRRYALRDLRKRGRPDRRQDRPKMWFPIYWSEITKQISLTEFDGAVAITPTRGDESDGRWRWGSERVLQNLNILEPRFSQKNQRWDVAHRVYLDQAVPRQIEGEDDADEIEEEGERTSKPKSVWMGSEFSTDIARQLLKELMVGAEFDYPKPVALLERVVQLGMGSGDLVLDFFAGSGTTAHAVMAQNAADGGNRRYILVQLPEPLDPANKDQKAAANFCDEIGKPRTIAELTKERLRRAAAKLKAEHPDTQADLGFRVYKLATSNLRAWTPSGDADALAADLLAAANNLVPGRSEDDLLVELLLKQGIDLTEPAAERDVAGVRVHAFGGGVLIVCLGCVTAANAEALADGIADWAAELAPVAPTTIFFKDSGFENDIAKANVAAILEQRLGDALLKIKSV